MKKIISAATLIFVFAIANAQSIKDYYTPKSPMNKVTFYILGADGNRVMNMGENIFYVPRGNTYEVMRGTLFQGQIVSIITEWVVFTNSEVKMIKSHAKNAMVGNKTDTFEPARTILKMPPASGKAAWTYVEASGDKAICTATWTSVTVEGKQKNAIKVVKSNEHNKGKEIAYYVRGIGLWKTELLSSNGTKVTYQMDTIEQDLGEE